MNQKMAPALVIMAAGIGSRYGGGIKQLEPVGANGEIIIDYSIHDAIAAGFRKIVFVIRHDLEKDFREVIGNRVEELCAPLGASFHYAFQEIEDLPGGFPLPEGRTKPWGTCHAVLSCRDIIREPFAVINADDYYGKHAFGSLYQFLSQSNDEAGRCCMAGFVLKNTLSENGSVTRGVCKVDASGYLESVQEIKEVFATKDGAAAYGKELDTNALVSMNMWGFSLDFMQLLQKGFTEFLNSLAADDKKSEFLLPTFVDQLLHGNEIKVQVLPTSDQWFGVTYKEDKPNVVKAFQGLMEQGMYQTPLFGDLQRRLNE